MNNTVIKENDKMGYSVKEAFNALRTNFMFCGPDIKTVVVTSCIKSEGKSTVSIELAKSLALAEKKVLFVDADLRKSVFASKYSENTKKVVGLTEYLSGQAEYEDVLYATQYENLSLIFAGAVPPNPVELLDSSRFKELIKNARDKYDYVIVDAAPLGMVIDASVISTVCDGSIIVITANEISSRFASEVKEQLEKSGCKVIGAILNKVPGGSSSYYSRYYKKHSRYGDYGYEHHDDKKSKGLKFRKFAK